MAKGGKGITEGITAGSTSIADVNKARIRPLLDRIDAARRVLQGQDLDVPMPSIVVVGDQSSGKSSVLESTAKVNLPRGSGMVTRVPIIIQLRNAESESIKVSYMKGTEQVDKQIQSNNELGDVLKDVQKQLTGSDFTVADTPVTVRIEGADHPDLTLIDLPGLIKVLRKDQPADTDKVIESLARKYLSDPSAVILAMASGNNDIENSAGLKMASEVDPNGTRTLVILTKSDLCPPQELYSRCTDDRLNVKNMGFVPVRCRSQDELNQGLTFEASRVKEAEFFRSLRTEVPGFKDLALGIPALVERLVELQRHRVIKAMPEIHRKVTTALAETQGRLEALGPEITSDAEAREALSRLLKELERIYEALVRGRFSEVDSFGVQAISCNNDVEDGKVDGKLMARFADRCDEFASELSAVVKVLDAEEYLDHIKRVAARKKGTCLKGLPTVEVFQDCFYELSKQFAAPSDKFLDATSGLVAEIVEALVNDRFASGYNLLLPRIQEDVGELIRARTDKTKVLIDDLLKAHMDPYGAKRLLKHDKTNLEAKKARPAQAEMAIESGPVMTLGEAEKKKMDSDASLIETRDQLLLYTKLVVSELEDVLIRVLRTHLIQAVGEDVQRFVYERQVTDRVLRSDKDEVPMSSLKDDMTDPRTAQERATLQRKIDALRKAAAKLAIN